MTIDRLILVSNNRIRPIIENDTAHASSQKNIVLLVAVCVHSICRLFGSHVTEVGKLLRIESLTSVACMVCRFTGDQTLRACAKTLLSEVRLN